MKDGWYVSNNGYFTNLYLKRGDIFQCYSQNSGHLRGIEKSKYKPLTLSFFFNHSSCAGNKIIKQALEDLAND